MYYKQYLIFFCVLYLNSAEQNIQKKESGNIQWAFSAECNINAGHEMQDVQKISIGENSKFFAICDGHGKDGYKIAKYVAFNLCNYITMPLKDNNIQINELIEDYFYKINDEIKELKYTGGSTASMVLIKDNKVHLAWCGDSTMLIGKNKYWCNTLDHRILHENDSEYLRIRRLIRTYNRSTFSSEQTSKSKILIPWGKHYRLGSLHFNSNGLGLSRGFGDFDFQPFLIVKPEILTYEAKDIDFLVIASDGLWNVIDFRFVYDFVKNNINKMNCNQIINELMNAIKQCRTRGYSDDISIILIKFDKAI